MAVADGVDRGWMLGHLADPHVGHGAPEIGSIPAATTRQWLERMLVIRRTEEQIADLVTSGEAHCPCHLAIGQEACAVGVASALKVTDYAFGAHRSHAHYLAMGGGIDALMAEVLGRSTGCSGGMGGSMHLIAKEHGLYGTVPIVGSTIPIAVGAGLAAQLAGTGAVGVTFFGDGATEEGVFHESMNLAASMKLPVIFVCENNLFASHLHISLRQPTDSVARYANAHRVESEVLDGNDVVAVSEAATRAVDRARKGLGPTFLELVTYRWRGHVGPSEDIDVGVKRNEELKFWKQRDPIARLRQAMIGAGQLTVAEAEQIDAMARASATRAVEKARAAPYPALDTVYAILYASGAHGR